MPRVELISWIDAEGEAADALEPNEIPRLSPLTSAGVFVREDDLAVTIALDKYPDGRVRGWMSIPKVCIQDRQSLSG